MATTQAQFVARLRLLLDDPAVPYTWGDALLRLCLDDGLVEYSMHFPRLRRVTLTTTAGQQAVDLEAAITALDPTAGGRLLDVVQVQCPPGRILGRDPAVPGPALGPPEGLAQAYTLVGSLLQFRLPLAGAEVGSGRLLVLVRETWYLFTVDTADAAPWDGPRYDEGLVLNLAARQAWRQAALLGLKTGADRDPGAQIAGFTAQIAAQLRARAARPSSRLLAGE